MDPSEVEFLGEKRLVNIIPNFNLDVIYLISGSVGPFRAGLPVKVPIWLAVYLKQKQKCRIINQEWMEVESLNEKKEMERMSKLFTEMPSYHYIDESHILLNMADDDIPDADGIRTAIKDIWDIRMSKLRTSVDAFVKSEGVHARLDHLTAMEINGIRPLLSFTLDQILRIQSAISGEASSQYSGNV
ncbi:probable DNA replication complex GINS protein PSF2 [Odontomachus brunneus]|uniref:probable DNA replication complex GINS protein PSF2 n=1 Tax=Odontomachus brunneus TaxID=486640 RepID=UPI0013F1A462|nr:probable DNA replication complex GINS protein PSF2 [Odontomachus brunneus]XP_032686809.1 probable DNA replication complex GINS protein PSF2 [Odontomachus brunneus]XP_032686810.1 probable DNA replication complex GINS protein PSF2 [Odontomachus brunneus]